MTHFNSYLLKSFVILLCRVAKQKVKFMNPLMDSKTETKIKVLSNPIVATLRSSAHIFEVLCEATGEWLSPAYNSQPYSNEEKKKEMRETLKKVEYKFHKVKEENGTLWITPPVGFWLSDGRLVSPYYDEGERVKTYYGTKEEILSMGRRINHIKDGPFTFLPS